MNEREIFEEALDLGDSDARAAFLDQACAGDQQMRARLEALLRSHEIAGSFLGGSAEAESPTIDFSPTLEVGTRVGPYKLLQQLGEGGMGVVFMAEQTEPVERRVAVKVIKAGMDTRQVIARFEAERQALAMMDHPNIAKVFDAGATDTGRPYFVMELVKGVPITQYCDEHRLNPRQRLELFEHVCHAIQHAHQKGIIHRDLKPSNVLVAEYDDMPVPKIIDFGVAKATQRRLTEKTMFTEVGAVVGTIEYMSPEQAKINQLDIDTRSDIYSLGVLLYELLTGETPFDRKILRSVGFDEMLRIIREEEPPKPSTRISSSEARPSVAANRGVAPTRLDNMIRGELDWIIMKALEKDRGRRYETASKFAEDVRHYLSDEPVVACPPSATYRFRKFARRNIVALTTTSLILLALLLAAGSIGWTVQDRIARQMRLTGQAELVLEEVDRLVTARKWPEALIAARRAEAVVAGANDNNPVFRKVRQTVVDLELVRQLDEARLQYSQVQDGQLSYSRAEDLYSRAFSEAGLELDELSLPEVAEQLRGRKKILGVVASALLDWQTVRDSARAATRKETTRQAHDESEGSDYRLLDLADEIDPTPWRHRLRKAIRSRNQMALQNLAESADLRDLSSSDIASLGLAVSTHHSANAAAALLQQAQRQYPDDFWINFDLAVNLDESTPSRSSESATFNRIALALRPGSVAVLNNLGNSLQRLGKLDEAVVCYSQAVEHDPRFAHAHSNLGVLLNEQKNHEKALEHHRKAVELAPDWATAHNNRGVTYYRMGQVEDAISCYQTAIERDPKNASAHANLASALRKQRKLEEAVSHYRTAITLNPQLEMAHRMLGLTLSAMGKLEGAAECLENAVQLDPESSSNHYDLGLVRYRQENLEEAIQCWQKAIALDPMNAAAHTNLGGALLVQERVDAAIKSWRKAFDLNPNDPRPLFNLGYALHQQNKFKEAVDSYRAFIRLNSKYAPAHVLLGDALVELGHVKEAVACYRTAIELDAKDPEPRVKLAWRLATADHELRNVQEALELAGEAVDLQPDDATAWGALGVARYRADRWQEAIDALDKARQIQDAENPAHAFCRAMSHWRLANKTLAIEAYRQAFHSVAPQSFDESQLRFRDEAKQLLGLRISDQEIAALAELESALAASPDNADTACALARQLATIDDPVFQDMTRALELARQAAAAAPKSRLVLDALSTIAGWSGDWQAAREARESLIQECGGGPTDWLSLSMIYWRLGDQTESRRWFDKAVLQLEQTPHRLGRATWSETRDKTGANAESDVEQGQSDEPTSRQTPSAT